MHLVRENGKQHSELFMKYIINVFLNILEEMLLKIKPLRVNKMYYYGYIEYQSTNHLLFAVKANLKWIRN